MKALQCIQTLFSSFLQALIVHISFINFPLPSSAIASLVLHQCSDVPDDEFVPTWDLTINWASSGPLWDVSVGLGGLIDQMALDAHYVVTSEDAEYPYTKFLLAVLTVHFTLFAFSLFPLSSF